MEDWEREVWKAEREQLANLRTEYQSLIVQLQQTRAFLQEAVQLLNEMTGKVSQKSPSLEVPANQSRSAE